MVLMESVKCLRKTSDEAPRRRGGGKRNAPLALPRRRLLLPAATVALQRRGLFTPLALALLITCSQVHAQPQPDSAKPEKEQEYIGRRNPWIAFFLSAYLPGSGQIYNHQRKKGAVTMGVYAASMAYCLWFGGRVYSGAPDHEVSFDKVSPPEVVLAFESVVTLYSVYFWALFDAPRTARRINRQNGWVDRGRPGVGLVFVPDPRNPWRLQPGVGLRAGF